MCKMWTAYSVLWVLSVLFLNVNLIVHENNEENGNPPKKRPKKAQNHEYRITPNTKYTKYTPKLTKLTEIPITGSSRVNQWDQLSGNGYLNLLQYIFYFLFTISYFLFTIFPLIYYSRSG